MNSQMSSREHSGQAPFEFTYCRDLHTLPAPALDHEANLHGGFALDGRPDFGHVYFGMPGLGLLRVDPDLRRQELIKLSAALTPLNFHSVKLGTFDGKWRLFLPANDAAMVVVVSLEGDVDFVLPRPEFEQYRAPDVPFMPTDTVLLGNRLYVADGYGANYISTADPSTRQWLSIFGGKTDDPAENGKFGTAHGLRADPGADRLAVGDHLVIADRPHSRIQIHDPNGQFLASHPLPAGAWPCGIDYIQLAGHRYGVIGNLKDPVEGRPAPIYILDAETYEIVSTIRPKEELGVELAQHLHNVIWHMQGGHLYLICQSWNPGYYFVLAQS
jgi:hypothetical protein